ncbi:MAG: hypothetical protein M0005_06525 [Actinomycetota bacterium]|nr:hypothetical protein [Actinomycetota bacterium]
MRNASRREPPDAPEGPGPMRDASGEPRRTEFVCACCQRTITTAIEGLFYNPPVGSPQRFCSPSCRQAGWRRRRAGAPEATPLQWRGGRSRRLRHDVPASQGEGPERGTGGPSPQERGGRPATNLSSAEALAAAHKPLHNRDNRAAGALLRGTTEDTNEGGELPGTAP